MRSSDSSAHLNVSQSHAADTGMKAMISVGRYSPDIFHVCREIPRSPRGEFELPEAVQFGFSSLGLRFRAIPFRAGVLDLSYRGDIAEVAKRLAGVGVEL